MKLFTPKSSMNKPLFIVVMILLLAGIPIVYTASASQTRFYGFGPEYYMISHLKKVIVGFLIICILSRVDYSIWKKLGRPIFFVFFILSVAALIVGGEVKGANRWIFGIQPSEFLKIGLFAWLCDRLSQAGDNIKTLACSIIQPGIPYLLFAMVLLLQPNLSMLGIVTVIVACVMITAGVNLRYLGCVALVGLPIGVATLFLKSHSAKRIFAFMAEEGEKGASGDQGEHALMALGNGGWTGTGFGNGYEKLGYLPEAHKDVVYAVIGEELGFVTTFALLVLYGILFYEGLSIAQNASTRFGKYFALALTLSLFANFAIHISVCIGLFPTTGQPLPFLSFGGSNLIFSCVSMGILLNISRASSGEMINEPYTSASSLETSVFRNVEMTRSVL